MSIQSGLKTSLKARSFVKEKSKWSLRHLNILRDTLSQNAAPDFSCFSINLHWFRESLSENIYNTDLVMHKRIIELGSCFRTKH